MLRVPASDPRFQPKSGSRGEPSVGSFVPASDPLGCAVYQHNHLLNRWIISTLAYPRETANTNNANTNTNPANWNLTSNTTVYDPEGLFMSITNNIVMTQRSLFLFKRLSTGDPCVALPQELELNIAQDVHIAKPSEMAHGENPADNSDYHHYYLPDLFMESFWKSNELSLIIRERRGGRMNCPLIQFNFIQKRTLP